MGILDKVRYGYNDLCIVPAYISNIKSRSEVNVFHDNKKLPIFASPMSAIVNEKNYKLWELNNITPILPRNIDYDIRYEFLLEGKWVAFSLSEFEEIFINNDDFYEECNVIPHVLIDVANGHMKHLIDICKTVKKNWNDNIVIMAGNIANPETYKEYCEAGIDYVRCSIGSGSCCTTASNTAIHYPIASLIDEINEIKKYKHQIGCNHITKVIADGGIRNYSDVVKALALGADYVMIGGLFTSLIESCGNIVDTDNILSNKPNLLYNIDITNKILIEGPHVNDESEIYFETLYDGTEGFEIIKLHTSGSWSKHYYLIDIYNVNLSEHLKRHLVKQYNIKKEIFGMSTKTAQSLIKSDVPLKTAEGITRTVEVKYTMKQWVENMIDYLKSAMSYCNCRTLEQFIGNQNLVIQSSSEIYSVNK